MSRKIEVVPYNINWQNLYEAEAQKITNVLGSVVFGIKKIAATPNPGVRANRIMVLLVV